MQQVDGQQHGERRSRCLFVAFQSSHGLPAREQGEPCGADAEQQPDDSQLGQRLHADVVRLLGDHGADAQRAPRDLERVRAVTAGGLVAEQLPRLLPPRPAVVRAQLGEPPRSLRDVAPAELVEPLVRAADGDRGRDEGNGGQPGDSGSQPRRPAMPLLVGEALAQTRAVVREAQCSGHAEREGEREPGAGSLTRRRGLEVVDEARLRRRPGRDDQPRPGSCDEHQQPLEAVATEPEPEHDARRGDGDPRPRVRQHEGDRSDVEQDDAAGAHHARMPPAGRQPQAERQRQRRDQGQRVPVADRVP